MDKLTEPQKQLYEWLVDYIRHSQHSPSIRQMMQAMNLKSPAPIQSRLEYLRTKGYIDWNTGKARTIRILQSPAQGLKVLGAIAAGGVEPYPEGDFTEQFDLSELMREPNCFALRVAGKSMIEDLIDEGDVVVMRKPSEFEGVKNGTIVAAQIDGQGLTIKHYHRQGEIVTLHPANSSYKEIHAAADQVQVQGVLVGVWRSYKR